MSLLYLRSRPVISFDETDPKHRSYYFEFLKQGTWGSCPVRFTAEGLNTDLVTYINQKLLNFYVNKEFNRKVSK